MVTYDYILRCVHPGCRVVIVESYDGTNTPKMVAYERAYARAVAGLWHVTRGESSVCPVCNAKAFEYNGGEFVEEILREEILEQMLT